MGGRGLTFRRSGNRGGSGAPAFVDRRLLALSNFSASNYFATASGGGEAGVATGFGRSVLYRNRSAFTGALRRLFLCFPGTSGWVDQLTSSATTIQFVAVDGSAAAQIGTLTLAPSSLNQIALLTVVYAANTLRAFYGPQLVASIPCTGYTAAASVRTLIGADMGSFPAVDTDVLAAATFRGTPSNADIAALAFETRRIGDLPLTMQGAAVTHHWSPKRTLRGQVVTSGQTAPAALPDNITAAAGDAMSRNGSPTVIVIDPTADGRKTFGVQGASATSYLVGSAPGGVDHASAYWWSWYGIVSGAPSSTSRVFASNRAAATNLGGWNAQFTGAHAGIAMDHCNGAAGNSSISASIDASMRDRRILFQGVWDGSNLALYREGVQLATAGVAGHTVAPSGALLALGVFLLAPSTASSPADQSGLYGFACGAGSAPTLGELQAQAALVAKTGRIQAIPGKTTRVYDPTLDTTANGGPQNGVPATYQDRIGTDHLTRVGSGLTAAQRVERTWSWERTPILQGAGSFTDNDFFEQSGILQGNTQMWRMVLLTVTSQAVASKNRDILTRASPSVPGPGQGWLLRSITTNSALSFIVANSSNGFVFSPSLSIAASDVGKLIAVYGVHDGSNLRMYAKRVQQGAGTSITGFSASANALRLGRHNTDAGINADGIIVWGFGGGDGVVPTLAEIQANHDAVMADEDVVSIPGKTDWLVSFKQDARENGGVLPAAPKNRAGAGTIAKVGAPALANTYARAFAW